MNSPAHKLDPEMPNLRPEVVEGYFAAPEHLTAEILDGELSLLPRPRPSHARVAGRLTRRLAPFDDDGAPGGWIILVEPELRLGDKPEVVVPDIAGWKRARLPEPPRHPFIHVAPDWVCEVLSDSTRRHDRRRKLPVYFLFGVAHVWLLDPAARTLEVFRAAIDGYMPIATFSEDEKVRAEPFDAIELDLAALWAW